MSVSFVVVAVITVVANVAAAVIDFVRVQFVLDNAARLRLPIGWLPYLGLLKLAGAGGVVLGLLGVPMIGVLAAGGLVLFFVGALVVHVRAAAYRRIAAPGFFLLLAVATLVLS